MAKMPVEIAIIGNVPTEKVDYAIRIGNSLQECFLFSRLQDSSEQELKGSIPFFLGSQNQAIEVSTAMG